MGKYKYLAKNVGLLTISNFATKLLSFFLVPLYTSVLTTAEYGTYDLFNTTVGVLLPILTLNVQEGVMRFALDKEYDRGALVTVGLRYTLTGSAIVTAALLILVAMGIIPMGLTYAGYFLLMFVSQALSGFTSLYIRGIDRVRDLSISSVMASAVTITLNIVMLLPLNMGLDGYFLANIIGPLSQVAYIAIVANMPHDTHLSRRYERQTKEMLAYSKPLIANAIAWWVNNVSDRYIVIFFCGIAANGVYSVASKIPQILNVFQTIFNQAWALSSVKDYDPEDKDGFFANTYRAYNCIMTLICSAIIVVDQMLAHFLYANDFYIAWKYVPWLTIAILFGALSGYIGGFFTAVKDSKIFATSTVIGAVTNVVLNIISVPFIGPLGAAIATTICYVVVWVIRLRQSRKYIKLRINLMRDITSYLLLAAQSITLLLITSPMPMYCLVVGIFFAIVLLYVKDIKLVVRKLLRAARR